jgi:hypothetical protein
MKLHIFERRLQHGFRVNLLDIAFIVAVLVGAFFLYVATSDEVIAFIPVHLCAVFFLFCNVFRVRTRHELVWVVSYAASAIYAMVTGVSFWLTVLAVTTPMIAIVVVWAVKSGGYRGVFSSSQSGEGR